MVFRFGLLVLAALVELLTTPVPSHASAAVPEPATIVLVGAGAGVLGVAAWLKRRRRK